MTAACYFEKYFVFVSYYLSYWETGRVISKISFGSTFFYERPVIFWHRNDWMSKYLYKAPTDLFKFTLNLNCNNELFKMFFFSHNNNTPITDYSSLLRKTELYKQFFKRENSRSTRKKRKCKIFSEVLQNTSFQSNQMLLSFSIRLNSQLDPRKLSIRGSDSILTEERGTKENFVK